MCHPAWLPGLSRCALSLQAPLSHAELCGEAQAGRGARPPAEPPLLAPALRLPGLSAAHQLHPHLRALWGSVATPRGTRPAPAPSPAPSTLNRPQRGRGTRSTAAVDRGARGSRRGPGRPGPDPRGGSALLQAPGPAPALMLKPKAALAVRRAPGHLPRHFQSGLCLPHGIEGDGEEAVPRPDSHSPGLVGRASRSEPGVPRASVVLMQTALARDPVSGALDGAGVTMGFSEGLWEFGRAVWTGARGFMHLPHLPQSAITPNRAKACGRVCSTVAGWLTQGTCVEAAGGRFAQNDACSSCSVLF